MTDDRKKPNRVSYKLSGKSVRPGLISLVEIMAAMLIASLIAVATLRIYTRANNASESIEKFIDKDDAVINLLQKIAQDIDHMAVEGSVIKLENKFYDGFNISRLSIENKIFNKDNKPETFEKIVWQSYYDQDVNSLTVYRAHSGINDEDKILAEYDTQLNLWKGRELFVPVYTGLSYFKIDIPEPTVAVESSDVYAEEIPPADVKAKDKWLNQDKLPKAIRICISEGPVIKMPEGGFGAEEEDKIYRTVAVNRIRKIKYRFIEKQFNFLNISDFNSTDINDINDVNNISDVNNTNNTDKSNGT